MFNCGGAPTRGVRTPRQPFIPGRHMYVSDTAKLRTADDHPMTQLCNAYSNA
ncbi:hypothetical protein SAMN04488539_1487 [Corynebacterium timonense]|uniref:Uncharacterized protein n=1 Tax=Corynebacterium timonense TaxID=441500 RepID=A0A1H1RFS6_9CORY|nr:hypothetical protein SAMN04488539_1487 [Corynebacterium timonense]